MKTKLEELLEEAVTAQKENAEWKTLARELRHHHASQANGAPQCSVQRHNEFMSKLDNLIGW